MLSLDRAVGDFEQADVLIEGKKISAVRPNISAPNAQVIDAKNRIVMPGFVDTHRHMWQGYLRNVLPDGSLEDYSQRRAAHVRRQDGAGRCLRRGPDQCARRGRQRRHLRARLVAHRDFARAHRRLHQGIAGVRRARRVRLWRRPERDRPGHGDPDRQISRRHRAAAQAVFLQRRPAHHALSRGARRPARSGGGAVQGRARRRRAHQHPCRRRRVRPQRVPGEGQCAERAQGRHHLHPLLHAERHRVEADQGHRRHGLDRGLCRDADGPRQSADPEGDRHGHQAEPQRRRRDLGAERLLHPDAHGVLAAEERGLGEAPRRPEGRRQVPHRARGGRIRHHRGRARQRPRARRSARSRPARRPTSSCSAPTCSTPCRSTTRSARWSPA